MFSGLLMTRLRFKWIYFKYWLRTPRENLLFDLYGTKVLNQRVIVCVNAREIKYALRWKTFPTTVFSLPTLEPPPHLNPYQVSGWYGQIFTFDYGTTDQVSRIGGRWDLGGNVVRFNDTIIYKAFQQVFSDNAEWEHTEYYEYFKHHYYPNNEKKLQARMQYNQFLFDKVQAEGYLARDEIIYEKLEDSHPEAPRHLNDEIRIAIGRTKKPILIDGSHRLAVAKLLGCECIPVRIVLVHPEALSF